MRRVNVPVVWVAGAAVLAVWATAWFVWFLIVEDYARANQRWDGYGWAYDPPGPFMSYGWIVMLIGGGREVASYG